MTALSKLVRLAALFWLLAVRVPGQVVGMTARTEPPINVIKKPPSRVRLRS